MGSPPVPLSQFVLKVHSRCDLACDHCYIYEAADQSWRGRPMILSAEVAGKAAQRIAEHASAHALSAVQVVLHGGEPLLAGRSRLEQIITALREATRGVCRLDVRIHTNGVLLSEAFCELFARYRVKVGISLDGDRAANDRHRRYADGRSSYDKVIAAIGLLAKPAFRDLYSGLLCTIDTANDPLAVYDSLIALQPPRLDFLLPHATWDAPPARSRADDSEYADWLIAIYDRWAAQGRPVQIRTFDSILSTLAGGPSFTEALGLEPATLAVIETDGSYEQVDSLKAAFDGAPGTGTNVFDHDLDTVARHPGIRARQQGIAGLCATCQQCPVVTSCGGGLYTHRHRTGSDFNNPSVYCADLLKLITHIGTYPAVAAAGRPEFPAFALAAADLDALAMGQGSPAVLAQLADAQHSLLRAMLGSVYQNATASTAATATVPAGMQAGWSLLTTLDREQPEALRAVLRHPYVRTWTRRCLELLGPDLARPDGRPSGTARGLAADLGHFAAIAAAAAVHARVPASLTVPVVDGAVHLPTLGRLKLSTLRGRSPAEGEPKNATVNVLSDAVTIQAGPVSWTLGIADLLAGAPGAGAEHGPQGAWQPVRMLRAAGLCVVLEDTDPYRDCYPLPAAPRLDDAEFARWQAMFQEAWQEIERDHGAYGAGLAQGLISLVPLTKTKGGSNISAASRHAPGSVGVARPAGPGPLALLLICGFQQVKLDAVLDLYDLYDSADTRLFASPWGDEGKQHLDELFRDAYAHLAGREVWRTRQRHTTGAAAESAGQHFVQWQTDTAEAIETIADSGSLTPLGASFVNEMSQSASR
jgi:uncharacterized protein